MISTQVVVLAKHSGYCPMCDKYISKNRSRVSPLPEPMMTRAVECESGLWVSADTGRAYNHRGTSPGLIMRKWVHHYCYESALNVLYPDQKS